VKIVVTGLGAQSSIGEDIEHLWQSIQTGKCGISPIKRFDVSPFKTNLGSLVKAGDSSMDNTSRLLSYGYNAAQEALQHACVKDYSRVALVLGTCNGILGDEINEIGNLIAQKLNINGIVFTVSTACASSTHAIGIGADLIRSKNADIVLAGGVDILTEDIFAGFHSLGLLSEKACAPFSSDMGTTLGEGSAFLILESETSALSRNIEPIVSCDGYGLAADAYHDTSPDPSGAGMAKAIRSAIQNANLKPSDIDYINAHGTATKANDASEWRAIQSVFETHANTLPVSSSKSFLGHAQGAAGALEAATTILSMNHDVIPPTQNIVSRRPCSPVDPVSGSLPRPYKVRNVICSNAAFGGVNAALVFSKYSPDKTNNKSLISQNIGISVSALTKDVDVIKAYVPHNELRGLDKSSMLLAGAVASILDKADIRPRSSHCKEIGLFVGQSHVSPQSYQAFKKSVRTSGIKNLSPMAFTRMVVNYATGAAGRIFGLKGPSVTIASDPDSGLTALILAANHLTCHSDINDIIVAGVDEPRENDNYDEKAVATLLSTNDEQSVILKGWALSSGVQEAIEKVMKISGFSSEELDHIHIENKEASAGLEVIHTVISDMKIGYSKAILISQKNKGSIASAIIIEKK
jgi:3-oxoacyl-[acyl-carrier-protein] synthase II